MYYLLSKLFARGRCTEVIERSLSQTPEIPSHQPSRRVGNHLEDKKNHTITKNTYPLANTSVLPPVVLQYTHEVRRPGSPIAGLKPLPAVHISKEAFLSEGLEARLRDLNDFKSPVC